MLVLLYTMLAVFHAILLLCFGEMNNDILGDSRDPLAEPLVHGESGIGTKPQEEDLKKLNSLCSSAHLADVTSNIAHI